MNGSLSVLAAADDALALVPTWAENWLDENGEALIATPLRILLVIVLAIVLRYLVHRAIRRLTDRTASGSMPAMFRPRRGRTAEPPSAAGEAVAARRMQRAEAIGSVLRSSASIVILGITVVLILGELGVNLAPILASAGVVGVALGFGAQNLIKDFIAGIGIILEDQYGVGDVVDLGEATGTVEAVGLRITRLRDLRGVIWYVRNGEVLRVGNMSQGHAQVVVDIPVAHDTDLERCRDVMQQVGEELFADPDWSGVLLARPDVLGVEQISAEGVVMRLLARTTSTDQWRVGRELRLRLKERFAAEGIKTPAPLLRHAGGDGASTR